MDGQRAVSDGLVLCYHVIFLQPKEDHILKYSAPEEFEEIEVIEITEEADAEGRICIMN